MAECRGHAAGRRAVFPLRLFRTVDRGGIAPVRLALPLQHSRAAPDCRISP
jgi:hypothetical protein